TDCARARHAGAAARRPRENCRRLAAHRRPRRQRTDRRAPARGGRTAECARRRGAIPGARHRLRPRHRRCGARAADRGSRLPDRRAADDARYRRFGSRRRRNRGGPAAGTGCGVTLAIVVPVKSPRRAKHRLEPVLSEPERKQLAGVMALEVFAAVSTLTTYGRFVISDDPDILEEARRFGLEPLIDRVGQGQSAAVRQGFAAAWERGFTAALTIPGDVPAVTPQELSDLCTYRPEIEVLLAPDRERLGTNGLRLVPPHAITLRFGEDSFSLHQAEARRANRSFEVRDVEGLRYDLDRPDDVVAFMQLSRDTATRRLLQELGAADRFLASTPPHA